MTLRSDGSETDKAKFIALQKKKLKELGDDRKPNTDDFQSENIGFFSEEESSNAVPEIKHPNPNDQLLGNVDEADKAHQAKLDGNSEGETNSVTAAVVSGILAAQENDDLPTEFNPGDEEGGGGGNPPISYSSARSNGIKTKDDSLNPELEAVNIKDLDLTQMANFRSGQLIDKVTGLEKMTIATGARFLYRTVGQGTTARSGLDKTADVTMTVSLLAASAARKNISASMMQYIEQNMMDVVNTRLMEYGEDFFNRYSISGVRNLNDINSVKRAVNAILKKEGLPPITSRGTRFLKDLKQYIRANEALLNEKGLMELFQILKNNEQAGMMIARSSGFRHLRMALTRRLRRYLQQTEAGQGLYICLAFVNRARQTLRTLLHTITQIAQFAHLL